MSDSGQRRRGQTDWRELHKQARKEEQEARDESIRLRMQLDDLAALKGRLVAALRELLLLKAAKDVDFAADIGYVEYSQRKEAAWRAAHAALVEANGELAHESCTWAENEEGLWDTDCRHAFVFDSGTPTENGMRFCCYCGKALASEAFER